MVLPMLTFHVVHMLLFFILYSIYLHSKDRLTQVAWIHFLLTERVINKSDLCGRLHAP